MTAEVRVVGEGTQRDRGMVVTPEMARMAKVTAMAVGVAFMSHSRRLQSAVSFSADVLRPTMSILEEWNLKRIIEAEIHFRQTMRHEGLADIFETAFEDTPFAKFTGGDDEQ